LKTISPNSDANTQIPTLLQETVTEVFLRLSKTWNTCTFKTLYTEL